MLFNIPNVLTAEQAAQLRRDLEALPWADGKNSAGIQAALAKNNQEIPLDHPKAREAQGIVRSALARNKLFAMTALPLKISDPMFNRYREGQTYGGHIDNAIRPAGEGAGLMRGDLSATLFLTPPEEYDGGELSIEDTFGVHNAKLPAGHMVLYPASSLHQVKPVTKGARIASFFWVQSMVRDHGERSLLLELDLALQQLNRNRPQDEVTVQLLGVYNNLLRRWAEL